MIDMREREDMWLRGRGHARVCVLVRCVVCECVRVTQQSCKGQLCLFVSTLAPLTLGWTWSARKVSSRARDTFSSPAYLRYFLCIRLAAANILRAIMNERVRG